MATPTQGNSLTFIVAIPGIFQLVAVHQEVVLILFIAVGHYSIIVVICLVLRLPRHLVLFLEATPGVGKPRRYLGERHLGDDGQHDLLALGGVRVLLVFVEPRFQRRRRFARGVLPPRREIVAGAVAETGKCGQDIPHTAAAAILDLKSNKHPFDFSRHQEILISFRCVIRLYLLGYENALLLSVFYIFILKLHYFRRIVSSERNKNKKL